MTEATARFMLVKQARTDGCTCKAGAPQIAFRESDSKRMVLVGHENECARRATPEMRVLLMHVSRELDSSVWEESEVES